LYIIHYWIRFLPLNVYPPPSHRIRFIVAVMVLIGAVIVVIVVLARVVIMVAVPVLLLAAPVLTVILARLTPLERTAFTISSAINEPTYIPTREDIHALNQVAVQITRDHTSSRNTRERIAANNSSNSNPSFISYFYYRSLLNSMIGNQSYVDTADALA